MQRLENRAIWTKRVEHWRASGRTAKDFAAELGVNPRTLQWWGWNLAPTSQSKSQAPCRGPKSSVVIAQTPATSPMTFVEMTTPLATETLEVVLPTAIRIRVRPGFDDTTLGRILDVLERR